MKTLLKTQRLQAMAKPILFPFFFLSFFFYSSFIFAQTSTDTTTCKETNEPNNSRFAATVITADKPVKSLLSSNTDVDVYVFNVPQTPGFYYEAQLKDLPASYDFSGYATFPDYAYTFAYQNAPDKKPKSISLLGFSGITVYLTVFKNAELANVSPDCYTLELVQKKILYDVKITRVLRPTDTIASSLLSPSIVLRTNTGIDSATVFYKLDNQEEKKYIVPTFFDSTIVNLPVITGYTEGVHKLSFRVEMKNGIVDTNLTNNVFEQRFLYRKESCSDYNEPNSDFRLAAAIPTDTTISALFASTGDIDVYSFETTVVKPNISIRVWNLPSESFLQLNRIGDDGTIQSINYNTPTINDISERVLTFSSETAGKYYVRVRQYYNQDIPLPKICYNIKVSTAEAIRNVAIENITSPSKLVASSSFIPSIDIKNLGNVPIRGVFVYSKIDDGSESFTYKDLSSWGLSPNESTNIVLPKMTGYTEGVHTLSVRVTLTSLVDVDTTDNIKSTTFTYKLLCGDNYEQNNTLATAKSIETDSSHFAQFAKADDFDYYDFKTTANNSVFEIKIASSDKNLSLSEFQLYRKNATGTYDYISGSYQYILNGRGRSMRFASTTAGEYIVYFKPYQESVSTTDCYELRIETQPAKLDLGLYSIVKPTTDTIRVIGFTPTVGLRNFSNTSFSKFTLAYQLDNGSEARKEISNYYDSSNDTNRINQFNLDLLTNYTEGWHTLKVRIAGIEGKADANSKNDTISYRFYYQSTGCENNYEPNNTAQTATNISLNTEIRSVNIPTLSTSSSLQGDIDYFRFTTTDDQPYFKIKLKAPNSEYSLSILNADGSYANVTTSGSNSRDYKERQLEVFATTGKTWIVGVSNSSYYNINDIDCYSLIVEPGELNSAARIREIRFPKDSVFIDAFVPEIAMSNTGRKNLESITYEYQIDSGKIETTRWVRSQHYQLTPRYEFFAKPSKIGGYTEGVHTFKIRVVAVNDEENVDTSKGFVESRFIYRNTGCFDNYEPNNLPANAILLPLDTTILSVLRDSDTDYYQVRTTNEKPSFRFSALTGYSYVVVTDLREKNIYFNSSYPPTWQEVRGDKADTFLIKIYDYNQYNSNRCYTLKLESLKRIDAARISKIVEPVDTVFASTFIPQISFEQTGNTTLKNVLIKYQVDSLAADTFLWKVQENTFYYPNQIISTYLKRVSGYTEGWHNLKVWFAEVNGLVNQDTQKVQSQRFYFRKSACDDSFEPNETPETAKKISLDSIYSGMIDRSQDLDFYELSVTDSFAVYDFTINPGKTSVSLDFFIQENDKFSRLDITGYLFQQRKFSIGARGGSKIYMRVKLDSYQPNLRECYAFKVEKVKNELVFLVRHSDTFNKSNVVSTTDSIVNLTHVAFINSSNGANPSTFLYNYKYKIQVNNEPESSFTWDAPIGTLIYYHTVTLQNIKVPIGTNTVKVTAFNPNNSNNAPKSDSVLTFTVTRYNKDDNNATLIGFVNIPDTLESDNYFIRPKVILRNVGKVPLKSVTILSGQSSRGYNFVPSDIDNWVGNLEPGDTAHVTLLGKVLSINQLNYFKILTSKPNGTNDFDVKNDTIQKSMFFIYRNPYIQVDMSVGEIIQPRGVVNDSFINPIIVVRNNSDSIIYQPYVAYKVDNGAEIRYNLTTPLRRREVREVTLNQINFGRGSHTFTARAFFDNNATDINMQNNTLTSSFSFGEPSSVQDLGLEKVSISPNPTEGVATLRMSVKESGTYQFDVIDLTGRVLSKRTEILKLGENQLDFDFQILSSGIYFVRINNQRGVANLKVIKN